MGQVGPGQNRVAQALEETVPVVVGQKSLEKIADTKKCRIVGVNT